MIIESKGFFGEELKVFDKFASSAENINFIVGRRSGLQDKTIEYLVLRSFKVLYNLEGEKHSSEYDAIINKFLKSLKNKIFIITYNYLFFLKCYLKMNSTKITLSRLSDARYIHKKCDSLDFSIVTFSGQELLWMVEDKLAQDWF